MSWSLGLELAVAFVLVFFLARLQRRSPGWKRVVLGVQVAFVLVAVVSLWLQSAAARPVLVVTGVIVAVLAGFELLARLGVGRRS